MLVEREKPTVRNNVGVVAFLPKRFALLQIETEAFACCANVIHGTIKAGTFGVAEISSDLTVKNAELLSGADDHDNSPCGSGIALNDDIVSTWGNTHEYATQPSESSWLLNRAALLSASGHEEAEELWALFMKLLAFLKHLRLKAFSLKNQQIEHCPKAAFWSRVGARS